MAENNDDNINIIDNSNNNNNNNNNNNLGDDGNDNIIGSYNYINYIINFNNLVNEYNYNGAGADGAGADGADGDGAAGDGADGDGADGADGDGVDGGADGGAGAIGADGVGVYGVGNNVINDKLIEIMSNAIEIMFTGIPEEYTEILEQCLLGNMRYDDNLRTTLTYTISQFISRTIISYERIVAVILNYASREPEGIYSNNTLFTNNYDLVYEICKEEIHRHLFRSYRMIQLFSLFTGNQDGQEMENVKLVMTKEDIVNLFPTTKYTEIKPEIKVKNERCIVCQEHFNDSDECRQLNCEHVYHLACIDEWLENHSYKCPCCRTDAGPHQPKL